MKSSIIADDLEDFSDVWDNTLEVDRVQTTKSSDSQSFTVGWILSRMV